MAYPHFPKSLDTLSEELTQFLGPSFFELLSVDHFAPWGNPAVLSAGHDGCYLSVTGTRSNYSTITFQVRLDLSQWGKAEVLAVEGRFADLRYAGDRYENWFERPHTSPYMLDILDRVDRMAAYALRLLEQHARETLQDPEFQLFSSVASHELLAVINYFRTPVQIDYHG